MQVIKGGYENMKGVRWSHLKNARRSMAHVKSAIHKENRSTDAMLKGSVADCALIEPEKLNERYFVMPEFSWNSKANKAAAVASFCDLYENVGDPENMLSMKKDEIVAWLSERVGKQAIEKSLFDDCKGMAKSVLAHPSASKLLEKSDRKQFAVAWEDGETGVTCKGLVDLYSSEGLLIDAKTTENAKYHVFQGQMARYDYIGQLAYYRRGLIANGHKVDSCAFLVVESVAPYAVACYQLSEAALSHADARIDDYLKRFAFCKQTDEWPGYADTFDVIDAPEWYYKELV